jgi:tetratricopeptide (TPR) repeat protein
MLVRARPAVRALALSAAFASVVSAQAPKACEVNESRPSALGKASLAVMTASSAQTPDAAKKQLLAAMKQLAAVGAKTDNPAGKGFVYGKALVLWAMQPGVGLDSKRGAIGLTDTPDAIIDLATSLDSAFKIVETDMPECIAETVKWRSQKPWVDLVNKAIERLNADDADSAAYAAQRAITLNPFAPYGYVVLANVKQRQQKTTEAFGLYRKSVDLAQKDTIYDDIRRQSLIYLGSLAADSAEAAADATARQPYIDQARMAFAAILADKGAGDAAAGARNGLCRVAIASGDTGSLRVDYKEPLANPASFAYSELMNSGVCMARAEMGPEAAILFQAAYEKNPYHRDVLSNLSIVLLRMDQHDRALPLASRLVAVEPNNPENLQLLVLSYAGIATRSRNARLGPKTAAAPPAPAKAATKAPATKAPATKAPAAAPASTAPKLSAAVSDSLFAMEKAYTDSAVSANTRKDSLAVRVSLSDFSTVKDKTTLAGSLSLSTAVNATEGDYVVKVEFLDVKGGVVGSQEAKVAVTNQRSGRFKVEGVGATIAAFRYAIVAPQ